MTTYGVTATGFVKKTLDDILASIKARQLNEINSGLSLLGTNVFGQINGIMADELREVWDVAEAVYRSAYPDSASDEALDQVCSLTGTTREASQKSTVTLDELWLEDSVTLPAGQVVSVGALGARFVTTAAVTNSSGVTGTFSATAESEDIGPVVGSVNTIDTIQSPITGWLSTPGITNGLEGSTPGFYDLDNKDFDIDVDETGIVNKTFPSIGFPWAVADAVNFINLNYSGILAEVVGTKLRITTLTEIGGSIRIPAQTANIEFGFSTTLVKGFNSADALLGQLEESDPDLRVSRVEELQVSGSGTLPAVFSDISSVDDVESVIVLENTSMVTDGDGLPPKSFEVIVRGGTDQDIADALWNVKPGGMESFGSTGVVVVDSSGNNQTVYFSRPTTTKIYFDVTVEVEADEWPSDGSDQIKLALVAKGALAAVGGELVILPYKGEPLTVSGVFDVTAFTMDIVTPAVATVNIPMGIRELPTFDVTQIDVTVIVL